MKIESHHTILCGTTKKEDYSNDFLPLKDIQTTTTKASDFSEDGEARKAKPTTIERKNNTKVAINK